MKGIKKNIKFSLPRDYHQIYLFSIDQIKIKLNQMKKLEALHQKNNALLQRKYYQCYCSKSYESYSALYLHVKNKHHQNLSFKSFATKRVQWSGSIKNIILQFDQEFEVKEKQAPSSLNLRQRKKKFSFLQSDEDVQVGKNRGLDLQIKSSPIKMQVKVEQNYHAFICIHDVLEIFINQGEERQEKKYRKTLIKKLENFINKNYMAFFPMFSQINIQNFCKSYSPINICFTFPIFLERQQYSAEQGKKAAQQLLKLSLFLYQNNFSSQVLVIKQQPQVCKVEEMEKIKVLKIQNQ